MNALDILTLIIFGACIAGCYQKGMVRSLYGLFSSVISLFLAWTVYPPVGKFLRATPLYDFLKSGIKTAMDLDGIIHDQTLKAQNDIISGLPVPEFFQQSLMSNNNPALYKFFNVSSLTDYIYAYLANIAVNAIALVLSLIIVSIIMRAVLDALNIAAKLPVIKSFNKLGGAFIGLVQAVIVMWVLSIVIVFVTAQGHSPELVKMVSESQCARWFLEHNLIIGMINNILP